MTAIATVDSGASKARRGSEVQPTPLRSRVALLTLDDVRAELARVYRMADRGAISIGDATKRAFILHTLGKVIEASEIEKRLDALEGIADGIETRKT